MEPVGSERYHNLSPKEEASYRPTFPKNLKYRPQHLKEEGSVWRPRFWPCRLAWPCRLEAMSSLARCIIFWVVIQGQWCLPCYPATGLLWGISLRKGPRCSHRPEEVVNARGYMAFWVTRPGEDPSLLTPGPRLFCIVHTPYFCVKAFSSSCCCEGVNADWAPGLLEQESVDFAIFVCEECVRDGWELNKTDMGLSHHSALECVGVRGGTELEAAQGSSGERKVLEKYGRTTRG